MLVVLFARRSPSDEDAIRAWFASPAGGSAPRYVTEEMHVSDCKLAHEAHHGDPVTSCTLSFGGVAFAGCFTIDDQERVRGGWRQSFAACSSVRWDDRRHGFVDVATGQPPPIANTS